MTLVLLFSNVRQKKMIVQTVSIDIYVDVVHVVEPKGIFEDVASSIPESTACITVFDLANDERLCRN
jgi:hypothetical protein